ncbi:hypothetical protein [Methylosinus sp. Sm6]|uniref:hypothetical protein n=1 Tax=Methylosinus sp. Sm6 TaxID=2866948 RepID=UPI001C99D8EA|nr:hypothetical protein [Methylosinus sp. Sm6]MBY6239809.1 hypothetical protein [Methylosinus sp. Sm6]
MGTNVNRLLRMCGVDNVDDVLSSDPLPICAKAAVVAAKKGGDYKDILATIEKLIPDGIGTPWMRGFALGMALVIAGDS